MQVGNMDIVQQLEDTIINETPARYPDVIRAAIAEIVRLRWGIYQAGSMHAGDVPIGEIMDFLRGLLDEQNVQSEGARTSHK